MDFNLIIGGEAGQGIQSSGFLLAKTFVRGGYHVFADQDYESRIRGGHSFFRIRVSEKQVRAITEPVNILIAMDKATIDIHWNELAHGGVVIYDGEKLKDIKGDITKLFNIPLEKLAEEKAGNKIMESTVALGAVI
ncbi:MAG: 2-oxoacid:acceptor oxidoreductase family protein, partial [Chloroflexi bacterium]|nr:2-oxoacid:acceptor oxidoreductase family protein [Chloroflexota bacterium]